MIKHTVRRAHRCGDHPHKISSTVTSAKYGTPRRNILCLANYYLLNRMCLKVQCLYCVVLKLRIVHPCLDSSLAWVGGWRGGGGVVEPFFGRQPHVLVSYLLSPSLMQPCIDCYIHDVQGTAWAWLWSRIIAGQVARLTWDSGTWFGEADQIIAHMESSNLMIYIIPFKSKNENDMDRDTQGYFLCYILEERCRLCVCAKKYISRYACAASAMIRVGWMMADAGRSLPFTLPALSFDPVHRPT